MTRSLEIRSLPLLFSALLVAASTTGCGEDDDKEDTGSDAGDGTTVADIQSGEVEEDAEVTVQDVIVTSLLTQEGEGFFVQDEGGGEYSGIYVYLYSTQDDLDIDLGDRVTLSGIYQEYYDYSELVISNVSTGITFEGIDADLTVDTLPAEGFDSDEDWEPWEGCLVSLPDQTVTSEEDYGEMGLSSGINVNDLLYDYSLGLNAECDSITGLIAYNYEAWTLNPRDEDDLSGCTEGDPPTTVTVSEIRNDPDTWLNTTVMLEGVVSTSGATEDAKGFFVQDEGGGAYSGLYVYDSSGSVDMEAGKVLDLQASVYEYEGLLELKLSSWEDVVDTGETATPVATELDAAPEDWEPYEGALVTLTEVTTTSGEGDYGEVDLDLGIAMDDLFMDLGDISEGVTYSTLTGPISSYKNEYKICPRSESDLVE